MGRFNVGMDTLFFPTVFSYIFFFFRVSTDNYNLNSFSLSNFSMFYSSFASFMSYFSQMFFIFMISDGFSPYDKF